MEGNINAQPKYILCIKSKSQHRKAIAVCHQCDDRQSCREYQQVQESRQVEQIQETQPDKEVREIHQAGQAREILETRQVQERQQVRKVQETQRLQQDKETRQVRQPELVQAMDTLVMAFNKKKIRLKEAKILKSALEELSALCSR